MFKFLPEKYLLQKTICALGYFRARPTVLKNFYQSYAKFYGQSRTNMSIHAENKSKNVLANILIGVTTCELGKVSQEKNSIAWVAKQKFATYCLSKFY